MVTSVHTPSALAEVVPDILCACSFWDPQAQHIVVAHGSRVEGFANSTSDVDVWVIAPEGAAPPMLPVFEWVADRRVQPESLSWGTLVAVATRVNAVAPAAANAVMSASLSDLHLYYRCATAVPVLRVAEAERLQSHFDKRHIAAVLACRNGIAAATELERERVFAQLDDRVEQFLCVRKAIEFAVDSFLAAHGEAYPNRKWRFEKLARLCGTTSETYQRVWRLKAPGDQRQLRAHANAACALIATLAPGFSPQPVFPARLPNVVRFQLARSDYLFAPGGVLYRLGRDGAMVWELLEEGRDLDGVIAAFAEKTGTAQADARSTVRLSLNALRSHGLVEIMPTID